MRRLAAELRRERPDAVHVQWSVVDRIDLPTWQSLPMPTIFTAHNATPREGQGESVPPARLQGFDAVVAHSAQGTEALRAAGLERVWHLPHGVLDQYATLPAPTGEPLELGDGPVVVLAGLLRPYKGVDVLLEAWPAVHRAVPEATLVIAGRPMGVDLPAAGEEPPGTRILARFLPDDEYGWLMRRADICCLPYRAIDLSGVLFAAMGTGTAMVVSDVGGFSELAGSGAELVPPGDPAALASTLTRLLRDPEERRTLAREAQAAARGPYAWDTIAADYLKHLARLQAERRAARVESRP